MTCSEPPPAALIAGIEQFNAREFYECHETLEGIWLAEPGRIRTLYQGILQVGVAFYHLRRGNFRGATSLLESGIAYLRPFAPECLGVNVQKLIDGASRAAAELQRLGKERMTEFDENLIPRIEYRPRRSVRR
jgi:predicted metal-dependent hydrolase